MQWRPEQIAAKLPVSNQTLYQNVNTDKARGCKKCKNLCRQKQKRMRYASGLDIRSLIPHIRPLSYKPFRIEARKKVDAWECDTVIGANRKGSIVTLDERKSDFGVIVNVAQRLQKWSATPVLKGSSPLQAESER